MQKSKCASAQRLRVDRDLQELEIAYHVTMLYMCCVCVRARYDAIHPFCERPFETINSMIGTCLSAAAAAAVYLPLALAAIAIMSLTCTAYPWKTG